mgnify:CR=1 FL=1
MKEIARGAESVIYEDEIKNTIIKDRLKKSYRIKELDDELRKQRTRREASLLEKVRIPHPKLILSDGKEKIVMEKIEGEKLREVLDQKPKLARRLCITGMIVRPPVAAAQAFRERPPEEPKAAARPQAG